MVALLSSDSPFCQDSEACCFRLLLLSVVGHTFIGDFGLIYLESLTDKRFFPKALAKGSCSNLPGPVYDDSRGLRGLAGSPTVNAPFVAIYSTWWVVASKTPRKS